MRNSFQPVKQIYRAYLTGILLFAATVVIFISVLCLGDFPITPREVLSALLGKGDETIAMVIREWRLPRAGLAVLIGAALGLSGAIFQSLLRNPLGSPDIIGFDAGAYAGAMLLLLTGGGFIATATGALAGGMIAAILVYSLAWKNGVQGFRLILIGIGIGQLLFAFSQWLLLQTEPETAVAVSVWGTGSLSGVEMRQLIAATLIFSMLIPASLLLTRALRQLELGDELAQASGLSVERTRRLLIFAGVSLSAMATAIVGPIAFIALVAPQLASKLASSAGTAPLLAALTGAALLSASDMIAQHGLGQTQVPVGVVTLCFGGIWFVWLLARKTTQW